ncbi:branched-chain amino acid transport system ATP-binding protein [Spirochaetota bacterium]|nr:branched-chain amino acid transport system ATP-binding protein [Spirochaetota bacterium]
MAPILQVAKLAKRFGGNQALAQVSFSAEKSEITAIIGPNGSGKSTLFNLLASTLVKDSGTILIDAKTVTDKSDHILAKEMLSRTFQDTRIFTYLTIRQHMELALSTKDQSLIKSFFARQENNDDAINNALNWVGLEHDLNEMGANLSYGQTKLLTLAMAIAKNHKILLLDEPVAGVNPKLRKKIAKILQKLRSAGETILLIEHDMDFVLSLADKIIVLDLGKVIMEGTPKQILASKNVLKAYLGR